MPRRGHTVISEQSTPVSSYQGVQPELSQEESEGRQKSAESLKAAPEHVKEHA